MAKTKWMIKSHLSGAVVCIFEDKELALKYVANMNRIEGLVLDIEERNN